MVSIQGQESDSVFVQPLTAKGTPVPVSSREGKTATNIWRVDADGFRPKQLTNGKQDSWPLCSPDGASFYYHDFATSRIMKMSGSPQLVKALPEGFMIGAASFSPGGKLMPEFMYTLDPATPQTSTSKVALVDVTTNAETPAKTFFPQPPHLAKP